VLGQRLTDLSAAPLPFARVVDLFHTHPQLAAKLFFSFSCEAAIYAEHLIAIGRRTALNKLVILNDVEALSGLVDFERTYLKPLSIADLMDEAA